MFQKNIPKNNNNRGYVYKVPETFISWWTFRHQSQGTCDSPEYCTCDTVPKNNLTKKQEEWIQTLHVTISKCYTGYDIIVCKNEPGGVTIYASSPAKGWRLLLHTEQQIWFTFPAKLSFIFFLHFSGFHVDTSAPQRGTSYLNPISHF